MTEVPLNEMRLINSVIIIHVYILIFILSFSIFVYIYIDSLNLLERSDDKKMNANPKNWSNVTGALTDFEIQTRTEKLNIYVIVSKQKVTKLLCLCQTA